MTSLHFRIVVQLQGDRNPDLSLLREYVERCDLIVHSIKRLELEKLNEFSFTEIIEFVADVYAEDQNIISNSNKSVVYEKLCSAWCNVTRSVQDSRPLLQLCHDECFRNKRKSHHKYFGLNESCGSISFGVHAKSGEFICYKSLEILHRLEMTFYHDIQELELDYFSSLDHEGIGTRVNSMTIKYKHIRNIIVDDDTPFYLYLDLSHAPLFYLKRYKPSFRGRTIMTSQRIMPYKVSREIAGKANVIKLLIFGKHKFFRMLSCLRRSCGKIPVHFVAMSSKQKFPPFPPTIILSQFECTYLWKAIESRNFTILEQAIDIVRSIAKLQRYCLEDADCLKQALQTVLAIVESGKIVNYWNAIDVLYSSYSSLNSTVCQDCIVPSYCYLIKRITVTPTRILLWPPDLMYQNRILRNFDSDYFLRVTFRDDDFATMNFRKYSNGIFEEVIYKPINNGITIGDRHYELLAWSSSQLREHGVSMYAKDSNNITASCIRRWTEIDPHTHMNIPKCLARMGQCFSQTDDTVYVPLDNEYVTVEPDIEAGFNLETSRPYCFSDGIGKISQLLSDEVKKSLRHGAESCAFQIRYGGCKGMLVIDPTLQGRRIAFRRSMMKFHCRGIHHNKLEIAKKSGPISLRLNRPLIAILNDLGVKHVTFLRLQENMLQNLLDVLLDEEKAVEYLNQRVPFSVFSIKDLGRSGLGLTTEPFFRTLLLALHRYFIDIIKTKANIEIDPAYARNMFGVLDETGKLEYGQVFVQYSRDISKGKTTPEDSIILKGTVMVTKCPCIHPADVRKFEAVDIPELHHIIDCIVFPQKGPRPHPDEMAGSDMDGDEYSVIWLKELFFPEENYTPPDYPKPDQINYRNVSDFLLHSDTNEVAKFLNEYIVGDQIGSIASAHLAFADMLGVQDHRSIEIAMKHSIAVDFAKTGCTERLEREEYPKKYPDFMEKFWKRKYRSRKSLGKMYRISRDFESENESILIRYHDVQVDPNFVVEGWEEYEQSAIISRREYNSKLRTILQTYGIHETEAFGGAFIKLHSRFRDRRDRAEIVALLHMWLKELVMKTKTNFFSEFGDSENLNKMNKKILCKASAWYIVTYHEKEPEFLSFPWTVSEIIANILILKQGQVPKEQLPLISVLEEAILKNERDGILADLSNDAHRLLNVLHFHCRPCIVEKAIAILTKWGEEEKIMSAVHQEGKFLFYKVFLKLIIYVAEIIGYVSKPGEAYEAKNLCFTTSFLCLSFFKYCMKLRFLNKQQVEETLPFYVYNIKWLAKKAMVTYHRLAVTGTLYTLCSHEYMDDAPELVPMKPIYIDSSILAEESPLEECKLRNAEDILRNLSEVDYIELRENLQIKKIIISALGTKQTLQELKFILYRNTEHLIELLREPIPLPENN